MTLLTIDNSNLVINNESNCVNDYYEYIVLLIQNIIHKNKLSVNIILNNNNFKFDNDNKIIKIAINYEHILVKHGGRSVANDTPLGIIEYSKDKKYYVRICNLHQVELADIIIDYSKPNIYNVNTSGYYDNLSNKHIYISPSIYANIYINNKNRTINSLTTFININEPRREKLLENIKKCKKIEHVNINNCFDKNKIQLLYKNSKILINIHQTDKHDTFEELRCLPALQNGVLVISEKSPLNHLIPYNDSIIWCDYDNIIDKVNDVLENYEEYYSLIFTTKNINILQSLDMLNSTVLENALVNDDNILERLAIKYSLDKSIHTGCHNYIPGYTNVLQNVRYDLKNVFEIGIGSVENNQMGGNCGPLVTKFQYQTGNSLKCWSEYFPNANIYGIDIYPHPELNNDRIKTFVADQNSVHDLTNTMNVINSKLDVIIDDGSHQGNHQVFSFMQLNHYLSPSGIYIIEDIQPQNINGFKDLSIFPVDFKEYINTNFTIEYYDTRHSCNRVREDDFMMVFYKI